MMFEKMLVLKCPSLVLISVVVLWSKAYGQTNECPRAWLENGLSCYKFVVEPSLTAQQAELECQRQHADLISVDNTAENTFVNKWLMSNDVGGRHTWLTGGRRQGGKYLWTSDGSEIRNFYFPDDEAKNKVITDQSVDIEYKLIVYTYDKTKNVYEWTWGRAMVLMAYICEIRKTDLWKIYQLKRDFTFGTGVMESSLWPVAPKITELSEDVVFFKRDSGAVTPVDINCVALGNPQPTYRWFRKYAGSEATLLSSDSHFTIINGRLYIQRPDMETDVGEYYCEASNIHGTVLSNPIHLTYGKLDEFSNVRTGDYTSKLYMGVEIDCQPPNYKPDARFNWFKGSVYKFIRPEFNPQMFLSLNGKLYISEIGPPDGGDYFCAVYLAPRPGERLASGQTLSRNSLAITLTVQGDNPSTYGPDIQDRFPQVFPKIPLVGHRMILECLAYGRLPLRYRWIREDGNMNPKAYFRDYNRVMIIEEALLQDSGAYTCVVDGVKASMNRTRYVKLSGTPSFPLPLQNQFLDAGSPYTWSCLAQAFPMPTYTWYKDGQMLAASNEELGITVRGRHLMFKSVSDKNNGVYECEATNALGTRRSSAQVTAVSFSPTFERRPVVSNQYGTEGGSITIACNPEGAPRPTITWRRDGGGGLPANSKLLPTGALEMTELTTGDSGTYVCEASNSLGSSESSVELSVTDQTVLLEKPESDTVTVNGTTTMRCKAAYDQTKSDVVYIWKFYNHVIDFDRDVAYSMPYIEDGSGTLYLLSAQYEHEGIYTCVAATATDAVQASAFLTVEGVPEPPLAVHQCKTCPIGSTYLELRWMPGRTHKYPITNYVIEARSELDEDHTWIIVRDDVSEEGSKFNTEIQDRWRRATVSQGLSPGGSYSFRVRAGNSLMGYSIPSDPSGAYRMPEAAPIVAPSGIGGGGGKERELRITWKALPRSQWGSDHIRYMVYYRKKEADNQFDRKWQKAPEELLTPEYYTVVGKADYYREYEVKVQAINNLGNGPNSSIVIVLSAEKMPNFVPIFNQANAINATAGTIEWHRVPNTREVVKGAIFAFQVNYWLEDTRCFGRLERNARFTRVYGDVTSANVIGLKPGADYCINMQMLNNAGLGPKSENYYLGLNDPAPSTYPQYVHVMSHGPDSVRISWRGIVNQFGDSPLVGYKAWYWKLQENIRSAKSVDFGRAAMGIIKGIEKNEIYRLRVMGYNIGGDGKKAPDIMFTLGGLVNYNPMTTEVMNKAQRQLGNTPMMLIAVIVMFLCSYL